MAENISAENSEQDANRPAERPSASYWEKILPTKVSQLIAFGLFMVGLILVFGTAVAQFMSTKSTVEELKITSTSILQRLTELEKQTFELNLEYKLVIKDSSLLKK